MGWFSRFCSWLSRSRPVRWAAKTATRVYQSLRAKLQALLTRIEESIANWLRSIEVKVGGVVVVFRGEARAEYYEKKQVTNAINNNLKKRKLKAKDLSDAQRGRELRKALTTLTPTRKYKVRTTAQQKGLLAENVSNRRAVTIVR